MLKSWKLAAILDLVAIWYFLSDCWTLEPELFYRPSLPSRSQIGRT